VVFYIYPNELDLIQDIRWVNYGQIMDVEIPERGGQPTKFEVTGSELALLNLIREGHRFFRLIQVYQGEPAYVDLPMETPHSRLKSLVRRKLK